MAKGYTRHHTKTFSKKELVEEHEKLTNVLKKKKKKDLNMEYKLQSKELKSYKKL